MHSFNNKLFGPFKFLATFFGHYGVQTDFTVGIFSIERLFPHPPPPPPPIPRLFQTHDQARDSFDLHVVYSNLEVFQVFTQGFVKQNTL